jgi:hypothetical protein
LPAFLPGVRLPACLSLKDIIETIVFKSYQRIDKLKIVAYAGSKIKNRVPGSFYRATGIHENKKPIYF